jgi:hypothetical protein
MRLWIGTDRIEFGTHMVKQFQTATYDNTQAITLESVKVGGKYNYFEHIFGLSFDLPTDDALSKLLTSYKDSNFAGTRSPGRAANPTESVQYQDEMTGLGLLYDESRTGHFAEGYLPINAKYAWKYAQRENFKLITFGSNHERSLLDPQKLGITSWEELDEYLRAAWIKHLQKDGALGSPEVWLAAAIEQDTSI